MAELLKQLELTHLIGTIMAKQQRIGVYGSGIKPTSIDSGAAGKMRALAGLGQVMSDVGVAIAKPIIVAESAKKGSKEAQESRTVDATTGEVSYGEVELQQFGWGANARNNALIKGIDAQFKNDVRQNLTRISVQADGNVDKYDTLVKGYFKGISGVRNIPTEVMASADLLAGAYRTGIIEQETTQDLADAKANYALELKTASDDSFKFIAGGNTDAAGLSITEVVGGINADPDLTDPQKAYAVNQYQEQVLVAFSRKELNDTVENEGYIAGLEYIEQIEDNLPSDMSMENREAYIKTLTTDISNSQKVEDAIQAEKAADLKLAQAGNALGLTIKVLDGTAGIEEIKQAGRDNLISVGQFNTLENQFATTGKGSDNADVVDSINSLIQTNPEEAAILIQSVAGSPSLSTRTASTMLKSIQSSVMKGGILQTEEAKRFSNHLKKNVIDIGFGAYNDPRNLVIESELQVVWAERVSNMQEGETIATITNELILANKKITSDRPAYAADYKNYLQAVAPTSDLYKALESGDITDAEADSIAEELDSYFNSVNAYNSFRQDYDSIMKGL